MKRNDQTLYQRYARNTWSNPLRFQRMLARQVYPRLEYFNRITTEWDGQNVLDLGCGGGYMSEALARMGAVVTGVDPCDGALQAAREHARATGLDIRYLEGSGEHIPLPDASMDRVVCVDVLEHVEEVVLVVAEIRRVLKPGGLFFFDTINRNSLSRFMVVTLMEDVLRLIPRGAHDPQKFIRPDELVQCLHRNGFSTVGPFAGMRISGMDRRMELKIALSSDTDVMYLGCAS